MIHKISLAQERYRGEHGNYYDSSILLLGDENLIAENLGIELFKSNNFLYQISFDSNKTYYTLRATLRDENIPICSDADGAGGLVCKQESSKTRDTWLDNYSLTGDNYYIEFRYPAKFNSGDHFSLDNFDH